MKKNNQPIFSHGGFAIYHLSEPPPSGTFVIENILGMEIGKFNKETDAKEFLKQRILRNKDVINVLGITSSLSQILIFIGLFFSIFSGFLISLSYAVRYKQAWIFQKIISGDSVKLFSLGLFFVISIFYIPIIFVFIGKFIKKCKLLDIIYAYLFTPLISFIFLWPFFENAIDIKINIYVVLICFLFIIFLIYVSKSFIENNHIRHFPIILLIPVIILIFSPLFNFSRIVIKTIGMGDRWIFLQILPDNPPKKDPELSMILSELDHYSGLKNTYCLFFQTEKSLYITKYPKFCKNQSMKGDIGPLIRVPMKYIIAIGGPRHSNSPSPTPPPTAERP